MSVGEQSCAHPWSKAWLVVLAAWLAMQPFRSQAQALPTHEETMAWFRRALDRHASYVSKDVITRYWVEGEAHCELKIGNQWNSKRSVTQIPLAELSAKSVYVTRLEAPQRAVVGFESPNDRAFVTFNEDGTQSARYAFTMIVDRHDTADRIAEALRHLAASCGSPTEPF